MSMRIYLFLTGVLLHFRDAAVRFYRRQFTLSRHIALQRSRYNAAFRLWELGAVGPNTTESEAQILAALLSACFPQGNPASPATWQGVAQQPVVAYTGSADALAYPGTAAISSTGVDACTLATPVAGSAAAGGDDGKMLRIVATTAHAHTVTTAAHKIIDGSSTSKDTATWAGYAGGSIELMAYGGLWYVIGTPLNVTLSEV
jgi:hypothetical protein